LLLFLLWFFLFRRMGGGGGGMMGNFGRSKHRMITKESSKVSFSDVAGVDEAREELLEIVEFLRDSTKFQRLGGRVPRGVLLVGQPGCGKTLLAKAVAGEADVPFFCISGSDFVEMFVGVGASRVRDLFTQAKAASPAIIFLDEIDAIGQRRGRNVSGGGGHDEREQTLNAILVEMDGFESSDQVIVIAATNRPEILDQALTRSGRFDRQIQVPLPDVVGREQILKIYLDKITVGDVSYNRLARGTASFSGAEIAALVNEAAIAAAMAGKDSVEMDDLEEARDKVRWGRARKSRKVDEQEREMTAYHEAGHALIQYLTEDSDPLHKVTIIPRGSAGGVTFSLPEKDRNYHTERYCKAFMQVAFGGRLAEEMFCDDITNGASQDITMATWFARHMVCHWGMSERLGFVRYDFPNEENGMFLATKEYSEKTAQIIDEEILRLVNEAEDGARKILQENRETVVRITQALMEHETLDASDIETLVKNLPLEKKRPAEVVAESPQETPAESVAQSLMDAGLYEAPAAEADPAND
ncbi:MAG: ATP-dependent zinc metalloprotease FtsH, partial [Phycisphaerales bacterium]|nr:ATP-dependent zinc metalloprotease FtsH [Phycisphaerales bacterium]